MRRSLRRRRQVEEAIIALELGHKMSTDSSTINSEMLKKDLALAQLLNELIHH